MTIEQYIQEHIDKGHRVGEIEMPFPVHRNVFKKNEIITPYGQIERRVCFIISGIIEIHILKDGEEKIVDFFFPGNFCCALTSLLLQKPTEAEVIALIETEVEFVNYSDLQSAYQTSMLANKLGRYVIEHAYLMKFQREKDFLSKSAEERYLDLVKNKPDLLKLVPVHKIAEYLGIKPESLSRIRKTIIS